MYGIAFADMVALSLLVFILLRLYRHIRDYGLSVSPRGSYARPGSRDTANVCDTGDTNDTNDTGNAGACAGNCDGGVSKRFVGDRHGRRAD